jgi:hypothetical protein
VSIVSQETVKNVEKYNGKGEKVKDITAYTGKAGV